MAKKIATHTRPFDVAEYLDNNEAIAAYLDEAMAKGDAAYIVKALGTVARARGMTQIAKDAQMSRESLYKSLGGDGNPEFATVLRVMSALGMRLSVEPEKAGV
ncbi:MAG: addiction module antidote protein [Hyphomicrobium sp.]